MNIIYFKTKFSLNFLEFLQILLIICFWKKHKEIGILFIFLKILTISIRVLFFHTSEHEPFLKKSVYFLILYFYIEYLREENNCNDFNS